jgi:hypothetical protein
MITLTWWALVGALMLAAAVGGCSVAVLFAIVANADDAPASIEDDEWGDDL